MIIFPVLTILVYIFIRKYGRIRSSVALYGCSFYVPHIFNISDIFLQIPFYILQKNDFSGSYWLLRSLNFHLFPNTLLCIVDSLSSSHIAHLLYYPWNYLPFTLQWIGEVVAQHVVCWGFLILTSPDLTYSATKKTYVDVPGPLFFRVIPLSSNIISLWLY